jgi:phosphoenolpyruvate-protein kinase (PTS system EI component)
MFPLVSTLLEFKQAKMVLREAIEDLEEDGMEFDRKIRVGMMVEVPSVVMLMDHFVEEVDFFSIGTNDLTQYILAADRGNAGLARLQDALDPAVLRAIATIVAGADSAAIPVAVCGELAGDAAGALVLVGLGVDELSADPGSFDAVKAALGRSTQAELVALAQAALGAPDAATVRRLTSEAPASPSRPGLASGA